MKKLLLSATLLTCAFGAVTAQASDFDGVWDKDRWLIRVRAVDIVPNEESTVNAGGYIQLNNAVTPEVDFTYFLTKNIAAELILATSKHDVAHDALGALGEAWLLPPTLTLQYHFTPDNDFSPYVGAGLNYSIFYGEEEAAGITSLNVGNGLGIAAQAGFDYWLNDHWGINLDVKKIWLQNIEASVNIGAITADIDVNPWVIGTGVSYRF